MLIRTQVQLEEEQYRALKALARRDRISLSEALRRLLARQFAPAPDAAGRRDKALAIIGLVEDAPDVAEHHDDYLAGLRE